VDWHGREGIGYRGNQTGGLVRLVSRTRNTKMTGRREKQKRTGPTPTGEKKDGLRRGKGGFGVETIYVDHTWRGVGRFRGNRT